MLQVAIHCIFEAFKHTKGLQSFTIFSDFPGFSMVFPWFFPMETAKIPPGAASLRLAGAFCPAAPEPGPAAARPLRARPAAAAALDGAAHGGHGHAQQRCLRWAVWGGSGGGSHR